MTEWKEVTSKVHNFDQEPAIEGVLKDKTEGQFGQNYILDVDGEDITVFGKSVIRSKLETVKVGAKVRITYKGEKKSESTGRTYQDFLVETAQ